MKKYKVLALVVLVLLVFLIPQGFAQEQDKTCLVYFTGVGCPHCAKADPVVLKDMPREHKDLVIIEYEIYQQRENAPLLLQYNNKYGTGTGIPLLIFDENKSRVGDKPIVDNIEKDLEKIGQSPCLLTNKTVGFEDLDLNKLPGKPKIWSNGRVLIKKEENVTINSNRAKSLLFLNESKLKDYKKIEAEPVQLSGKSVKFSKAVDLGSWELEYAMQTNDNKNPNKTQKFGGAYLTIGGIIVVMVILLIYIVKKQVI